MAKIRTVLLDLYGTLIYQSNPVAYEEISEYLYRRGYNISPQEFRAAFTFVAFIDYPKYGYRNWHSFIARVFSRLETRMDKGTLNTVAGLYENRPYQLYPDAAEAIAKVKKAGFRLGLVTAGTRFMVTNALGSIRECFDLVMTSYEAGCDKSNPKMYLKALKILGAKPEETVMVGDDLQLDVVLPKSLGINAVFLDRERKTKRKLAYAIAYDLKEAMETIIKKSSES